MANKEGFGAIFRNANKQSEKSPDYSGTININGKEIKLSCWVVTSKLGVKYLSLRVNTKRDTVQEPTQEYNDDEVPF